jgi:Leucine-rich repeat (LRR) protein
MKNMKKSIILVLLIFLSSCTKKEKNIEIIDLSGLKLTQIPDSVFIHTELKELYLGAAGFIYYPALSGMLPTTQTGYLVNNLTELDTRISELKNLKILNLTSNRLKELPDALTELNNLEVLDLSFNHDLNVIAEIPKLKQLPKLKMLIIINVQLKEQVEIVKRALEPNVQTITEINEYLSLDPEYKKSLDSIKNSMVKKPKINPADN